MGNTVTACTCGSAGGELIHPTNKRNNGLLGWETEGGGGSTPFKRTNSPGKQPVKPGLSLFVWYSGL